MNSTIVKIKDFLVDMVITAKDTVIAFAKGFWEHIEAITITTLASLGLSGLLSNLPFMFTLPAWVESPMVIPVVAVIIISLLLKSAQRRAVKRQVAMA